MAVRSPRTDRSASRLGAALAVALGLHVGLLLWFDRQESAPAPRPVERITIELRPTAPPTAPVAPITPAKRRAELRRPLPKPTAPRAEPAPEPIAARAESTGIPAVPAPPAEPETPRPAVEAVQPFHPDALANALDGWRHAPGSDGTLDGPAGDSYGDGPEGERRRVETRVDRDLARGTAERRVEAGLVDPYFHAIRAGVGEEFEPTLAQVGVEPGAVGEVLQLLRAWSEAGRQFAQTGNPFVEAEPDSVEALRGPQGSGIQAGRFDTGRFATLWNDGAFTKAGVVVVLELEQHSDGRPLAVRVLTPSGSASYDSSARDTIRRIAGEHAAPPHGLGLGADRIRSVWRFETKLVPQAPVAFQDLTQGAQGGALAGLGMATRFDEVTGEVSTSRPGEIRLLTRIVLVAVYGGETGPRTE